MKIQSNNKTYNQIKGDNEITDEYYELTCPNETCRFLQELKELPENIKCPLCGFEGELEDFE